MKKTFEIKSKLKIDIFTISETLNRYIGCENFSIKELQEKLADIEIEVALFLEAKPAISEARRIGRPKQKEEKK